MRSKIALLGIYHESNTFLKSNTSLKDFERGHLIFGENIRQEYANAFHEIGGMLEVLDGAEAEAVPLVFAEATPGGTITDQAAEYLFGQVAEAIDDKGPFDGILVAAHGAAVAASYPDMDGWWLQKLRELVGNDIPIIGTLDPHANVSQKMIDATNALVAYKTNPHIDQRETGKRTAQLMVDTVRGKIKPRQHFLQPATTISIEQQYTSASPCKELYSLAQKMRAEHTTVLEVSVLLGFPYADVQEMGSGFIVVTDNDEKLAQSIAGILAKYLWENRADFVGRKISVGEALALVNVSEKPVLLLDMGDNVGGGSPGDGTLILNALEQSGRYNSFVCLYDPQAVNVVCASGIGRKISIAVGGKTDQLHGEPYHADVTVKKIADGVFTEDQPRHGGQVNYNMGKTAIVKTGKGTTIMLTSLRIVPFSLNQLTTFGIDPLHYDVIVAKGVHAPMAAYASVCKTYIRVNTEGITQADMTRLAFNNRRRPLYPFEG